MKSQPKIVTTVSRLITASHDFAAAIEATELLIENREKWKDSMARRAIETGIVISYARPFGENDGLGSLPKTFRVLDSEDAQRVHDRLLKARDIQEAHNNVLERGSLILSRDAGDDPLNIEIEVMSDGSTFWDVSTPSLDVPRLERLLRMLRAQKARVDAALNSALVALFEEYPHPPGRYRLLEIPPS